MNVLFLADAVFQDLPGGSRTAARELARGLTLRGHSVTFLVARQGMSDAPDDETRDGVRIVRYGGAGRAGAFVREGRQACQRLLNEGANFDIVHTHFAYAGLGPLSVLPKSVPRVRTFHGPWDLEGWGEDSAGASSFGLLKARLKRVGRFWAERASLRGAARVLVLSDFFRQHVTGRFGIAPERVQIIPGGTDTERFQPPADKRAARRALGWPESRRIILSVRRLASRMGLDNLVKAMSAVTERHPDALLLVGGTGPEAARLQELIDTLRLQNHVRLLGFVPDADLAAAYGAADVFVLPTLLLEGFGLVTTESLACGTPVLGTPVGATPEILRALEPRLVTEGTVPDALARAIAAFLDGPEWAKHLTPVRLHGFVVQNYTWERHVLATEAVYEQARHNS